MSEASDDLLSVTEAAEYLGMTRPGVLRLTKRPEPGLGRRVGTMWVFTREELADWRERPRMRGGRPPGAKDKAPRTRTRDEATNPA